MDKNYQFMMDCIGRLLTASEQNQETAEVLLHRLKRQLDSYEEKQKQLESRISASVNTSLQAAIERSVKDITVSFDQAKDAANNAAQRYETSSRGAIWKVVLIGGILFGIFAAMTFGFLLYYLPSPTELNKLISTRNTLLHQMEDLRKVEL